MAHLTLCVLGELQVSIDNLPVSSFESDKVRALLAYLAVEASRFHRRETLIGLLWPDCSEQDARHNLSQALFNLRLALGDHTARPPYLRITRDAIQINPEGNYSLDLDQFNAYFSDWEKNEERDSFDCSYLLPELDEMVQLYRGKFLQQFYLDGCPEYEEWILIQREAIHQRVIKVLTALANAFELCGDFQAAHSYALRLLELDPWREEAHCQIMRVLAFSGQRSAALAQFEICRKVLAEELGVEPSKKTRDLYEQIRSGTLKAEGEPPISVPAASIHNLPIPLTPFIGREQELADLTRLISDPGVRCITLLGPGGIGKTRLALQAAEQHCSEFPQGCAFIPLASVGSIEAVIPAIANGIGFAFHGPTDPKVQLLNYLRDKHILLVVDNIEHLLEEGSQKATLADLLIEILQAAGQVSLVVTSRIAMNLQGERIFEVRGLTFPDVEHLDRYDEYSAVALFIQRARRVHPAFELRSEDKAAVIRLCRMVEGLPLAIELAAAWVRILSPAEIAREIENNLDFLNSQMRDLPERHRSMRAVFDHSWQMLSAAEKQVLCKLSIFRGGFQRQAAEQVAGATLPVISSLVIRSLLRRTTSGRYDLHELIRQYTASKLAEDAREMHKVEERHCHYCLGLLMEKGVKLQSHDQKEAVAELTVEMDNIRAAWNWSFANQNFIPLFQVSARLMHLFEVRNWFKEGEDTFRKAADALRASLPGPGSEIHQVALYGMLAHYGFFQMRSGKGEEAYATLMASAAFLRTSTEPLAAIYSQMYLGIDCWILGKFSEAKECLQESLALSRKYAERWFEAMDTEFLGRVAIEQGDYNQARQYLSEAITILRQLGDPSMTAHALSYFGRTLQALGEYREAEKQLQESLELARGIGYRFAIGLSLDGLGNVAYSQGRYEKARALFSESAALFREMGDIHRLSRTLNRQGFNSLGLKDLAAAQNEFKSALSKAHEGGFLPSALHALVGLSELDAQQRPSQENYELVVYILQQPSSTYETKNRAERLRAELTTRLRQDEIEAAERHVGLQSLDEFVHRFLDCE